jgi:hypothetical protein
MMAGRGCRLPPGGSEGRRDRLADAEVFAKGIARALKYDATYTPSDGKPVESALDRYRRRRVALEAGGCRASGASG